MDSRSEFDDSDRLHEMDNGEVIYRDHKKHPVKTADEKRWILCSRALLIFGIALS